MFLSKRLILFCSAVLTPVGAIAQEQSAQNPEIIVEGQLDPSDRIESYVRELTPARIGE